MIDFATRAYNHSFPFDPIVRSLMDTDFYKLLMMQFIWERYPAVRVSWKVTNRTKAVKLAEVIDIDELRAQLDHARTLRFSQSELIWLRGNTFYGREGIFKSGFIDFLRTFKLPEYQLSVTEDGQIELIFDGAWCETTLWEIYALTIINEMLSRSRMKSMQKSELDIMYARAKVKLYDKLEQLAAQTRNLNLTDFGTRRRHGFLWQEHCIQTACEVLGDKFTGTSNVYLAMKHGLEAKGTNAHELPMVFAALARQRHPGDAAALRNSQYDVLKQWQNTYQGNLLVFLPDTFGTTQFLAGAPQWVANWTGARPDSKEAFAAGEELIAFWKHVGLTDEEVANKLIIFSDGLDVPIRGHGNGTSIIDLWERFNGRVKVGFGWGTNLTNDFLGCSPRGVYHMRSLSLVCKVFEVNGHGAVKLSDNIEKATGPADEIEYYKNTFGVENVADIPVLV